jgi:hypothetical protein
MFHRLCLYWTGVQKYLLAFQWLQLPGWVSHHEAFGKAFCAQETVNLLDDILGVAKSDGDGRQRERLVVAVLRHVFLRGDKTFPFRQARTTWT